MVAILLILLVVVAFVSLFYRPFGTGYYSYAPSGLLWLVVFLLLMLWLLGVI